MGSNVAVVRQRLNELEGVTASWFEWERRRGESSFTKTLVVEIDLDTDPNASGTLMSLIERVEEVIADALTNQTTMTISSVRIVPILSFRG